MLGPSVMFAGPPFCAGYAFHACRRPGATKYAAWAGLVLAGLEALFLVVILIVGLFESGRG